MASTLAASSSRASTPESPLAKAATTIDDLTAALSNFSRAPTPDPAIICCCRRDDCESSCSWASFRAKLESRLVLSAEVGQALLQRHEAYVRRQDTALSREASLIIDVDEPSSSRQHVEFLTKKLDTVTEENTLMESRINELLIKHEASEASNRTIMRELQEARATLNRLSAQRTRSIGWEMRLSQQTQEKEDMRQERDSESHRARVAESKAAAFVEKCSKLQNEVHALREEVHNFRESRAAFSKNVLQEARTRLEALQHSLGRDQTREDPEITRVLESLVADNETLKRDTAELQNLLLESRDDVRTLREELEEHHITTVGTPPHTATYLPRSSAYGRARGHHPSSSMVSAPSMLLGLPHSPMQHASPHISASSFRQDPISLSGNAHLLGDDAIAEWRDGQHERLLSSVILNTPSRHSGDADIDRQRTPSPFSLDKYRASVKSPLPLNRSRGVQTDPQAQVIPSVPSPRPSTLGVERESLSTHAQESRSDTSSISQQLEPRDQGAVAAIVEKVAALLVRMLQADVRTLTNRLKRQHLLPPGGDARHLSHSTISSIVTEVANLRPPPVSGRDDAASNSSLLTVTRADIKALLKLFKDAFTELGVLREQINEVVFDPSVAHKIRKEAGEPEGVDGEPRSPSAMGGWIAPIQKLFTNQPAALLSTLESAASAAGTSKPVPEVGRGKAPPRVVPKLAPAIAASSTTVNVEFASSGVRKTDTSDGALRVSSSAGVSPGSQPHVTRPPAFIRPVPLPLSSSRNLMGIFAGAPQSSAGPAPGVQRWEMPPKSDRERVRQIRGAVSTARLREPSGGTATLGRSAAARTSNRLSRHVDAVIDQKDDQIPDFRETLLGRTLRPRGLSDSSIHTTFLKDMISSAPEKHPEGTGGLLHGAPTDASSSSSTGSQPGSPPRVVARPYPTADADSARSPAARLGRHLASWATAATGGHYNDVGQAEEFFFGSPREDANLPHPAWTRRGMEGRDI
ncbi:hypothetical protein JB92DRAFT_3125710 [Gautieria morchelliformis]|nr:hypothetical protein JB92DRAFT_3125710 [Gautieria morchelliformis]